ncbi:hypothetical protein CRENBAI_003182 [Crenichthys baileyi]|uniref:Uncharacterized protein n=1 Tax=Crenichthys baileyi TaxID=28760 RepID=A0AAV9RZD2_9TELE
MEVTRHHQSMSATGGGKGEPELTPFEKKMASILGETCLCGIVSEKEGDTDLAETTDELGPLKSAGGKESPSQESPGEGAMDTEVCPRTSAIQAHGASAGEEMWVRVFILRRREARREMDAMPQNQVVQHITRLDNLEHLPRII